MATIWTTATNSYPKIISENITLKSILKLTYHKWNEFVLAVLQKPCCFYYCLLWSQVRFFFNISAKRQEICCNNKILDAHTCYSRFKTFHFKLLTISSILSLSFSIFLYFSISLIRITKTTQLSVKSSEK